MPGYFPQARCLKGNLKVKLVLSNYARKADLKRAADVDTSKFSKIVDLASLKSEIDKLNIGELETTPVTLRKLTNVV